MTMQKKFFTALFAALFAFFLAACSSQVDSEKLLTAERATAASKIEAAKLGTELRLIREAEAKKLRLAAAQKEVGVIAQLVVRGSQLTDRAGCKIVPEMLSKAEHREEFGVMMAEQYRGKCAAEVASYVAERKAAAAKAVAAAKAKEQRHAAATARPAKLAKADTRKK